MSAQQSTGVGEAGWFVQVAGEVRSMTLDQLDAAFRGGVIDTATPVWTEGMPAWATLGALADLEGSSTSSGTDEFDVELEEEEEITVRGQLPPPRRVPRETPLSREEPFLHSTAPLVLCLSEPVIPLRAVAPKRDLRLWLAAAAAVSGLALYGASVLHFAGASNETEAARSSLASAPSAPAPVADRGARDGSSARDAEGPRRAVANTESVVPDVSSSKRARQRSSKVARRNTSNRGRKLEQSSKATPLVQKKQRKAKSKSRASRGRRGSAAEKLR